MGDQAGKRTVRGRFTQSAKSLSGAGRRALGILAILLVAAPAATQGEGTGGSGGRRLETATFALG